MTHRSLISGFIILLALNQVFGQHYEMKKQLSLDDKKELLDMAKGLFEQNFTWNIAFSVEDISSSFTEIKNPKKYDNAYFKELNDSLSKDSLNAYFYYLMGMYYSQTGSQLLAKRYFQQALDSLTIGYFKQDSAQFLAWRGILKYTLLYYTAGIDDFKRSLLINPTDSNALTFYSNILLSNGKYVELREICENALEKKKTNPIGPYTSLVLNELLFSFQKILEEIQADTSKNEIFWNIGYNQLFDFRLINKYSKKFEDDTRIKNARIAADIFALTLKAALFDPKDVGIAYRYPQNDLKNILKLQEWLLNASGRLNEYTRNKYLGYIYFMQNNYNIAKDYFAEAIEVFPPSKKSNNFNPNESYNNLLTIYLITKDTTGLRKLIEKKIEEEPTGKKSVIDYQNLAFHYFLTGEIEKAKVWCKKARDIDANDFETKRLLAHIYFLQGMGFMTKFYFEDLGKQVSDPNQVYKYGLQLAIYHLCNGDAKMAFDNIAMAREAFLATYIKMSTCELCDKLATNYIKIND